MKKFTRRSYNRKLIMFAVSIFMAVGLISTGFSAGVMSANSEVDHDAPVEVGIVTDASMVVTIDQWKIQNDDAEKSWDTTQILSFDAPATDNTGRIRADAESREQLTMLISGEITNANVLGNLTLTITLPTELRSAISAGYIKVKGFENSVSAAGTLTVEYDKNNIAHNPLNYNYSAETGKATFSYTLELEWGEFFGGKNPSEFYDTEVNGIRAVAGEDGAPATTQTVVGKNIENQQMKDEMNAFRAVIAGGESGTYSGTIHINVVASAS